MTALVIVADATDRIGAGHVMRCAALCDAWKHRSAGPAVVVGDVTIPFVRRRLANADVQILDAASAPRGRVVVVVDSYDPRIRNRGIALADAAIRVFVDDLGEPVPVGFDVVWNPNVFGSEALYPGFRGRVIGGPTTVPLRDDLPSWALSENGGIGITLGGANVPEILRAALLLLRETLPATPFVATGDWAPSGWKRIGPDQPWHELARCRAALVPAGSTLWEASAVGIPVAVVQTYSNQRLVFEYASAHGIPCVDAMGFRESHLLLEALGQGISRACPAPPISNGAPLVAQMLHHMAAAA
jgi:UDP-2,4-diacetamido-2,4,6-trideoxy-beta-L-altropyranose hydrolase